MHISFLKLRKTIFLARKAQMALLLAKEVIVLAKSLDFADVFLEELPNVFSEQTRVSEHTIKLEESK